MNKLWNFVVISCIMFENLGQHISIYKEAIMAYGPLMIILLIVLIGGKIILGKINFSIYQYYDRKKLSTSFSRFLEKNNFQTFKQSWKTYFAVDGNKSSFLFTVIICFILMAGSAKFIAYNAGQQGTMISDPIMPYLEPINFSKVIFFLEYISVVMIVFFMIDKPEKFKKGLWTVAALFWLRTITIKLLPLSPPQGMIFLVDPFTQFFFGENVQVSNDLFFSGHVSLVVLFSLIADKTWMKVWMGLSAAVIGFLLIWQRVHYTTDIVFAPIFTYMTYELVFNEKWKVIQQFVIQKIKKTDEKRETEP